MSRSKDSEVVVPLWFTTREGNKWIKYEGEGFTMKQLRGARIIPFDINKSQLPATEAYFLTVSIPNGLRYIKYIIHSLAFDNPSFGWGYVARWDVVNGWTTTRYQSERRLKQLRA